MADILEGRAHEPPRKRARLDGTCKEPCPTELTQEDHERAVGITHFVSPNAPGFRCILKQRYTDFLVNEISPDGQVLRITQLPGTFQKREREDGEPVVAIGADTIAPAKQDESEPVQNGSPEHFEVKKAKEVIAAPELSSEDAATLNNVFGEGVTSSILNLYSAVLTHPRRKPRDQPTVNSSVISEKSKRTEAHVAIRRIFQSKLLTETLQDEPGVISIKAASSSAPHGARGQANSATANGAHQKGRLAWDELGGEWLHFTLYKENKDTMEVLYFIASQLKMHIKNFQFAGTKDRRGVTTQRVAVFRIRAERIAGLLRYAKGWVAGGFEYRKHGLELGELAGNEFLLTLRDCRFDGDESLDEDQKLVYAQTTAAKDAESFRAKGFINYYGLQRFGTFSTGTHVVGMKMLQGDLEGAIDAILTYSPTLLEVDDAAVKVPQDDIDRAEAIHSWRQTGRSGEALSKMPRRFQSEVAVIQYLSKVDKKTGQFLQVRDWQGALMQIQRNMRLMYVHAYQSLIWNTAAGKRWEMFGEKVVEGDLVIVGEKDDDGGSGRRDEVDDDGEPIVHPAAEDSAPSTEDAFTRARPLSKAEAESGKYDVFDIVLPLPGFDVLYPTNAIGRFYEDFMGSEQGGKLDPHKMRRSWKDVSLSGGYRKIMARPGKDFSVDVREYEDENEQMVETDVEGLKREAGVGKNGVEESVRDDENTHPRDPGPRTHKKIAVVMKLQLGGSQYATMALRELTKGGAKSYRPEFSATR